MGLPVFLNAMYQHREPSRAFVDFRAFRGSAFWLSPLLSGWQAASL